jgi:hypothetical protein
MKNIPSPWMNLPIEQLKEMKDRYKLTNDIEKEAQREQQLQKEKMDQMAEGQVQQMKQTLPFLDQ